jgi:hypothetical protein
MKTSSRIVILLMVIQGLGGCGSRGSSISPAAPSPATATPAPAPVPAAGQRVFGYVSDTAFRAVADVKVEVLDGSLAGQATTTAANGQFTYPGTLTGAVTFRATKPGYVTATQTSHSNGVTALVLFQLDVDAPPVQIAGDYSLTFVADSACAGGLPKDVPALTYDATIARQPAVAGKLDTQYTLRVHGSNAFVVDNFAVGVAGDAVTLNLYNGEDAGIVERVPPAYYLALSGQAQAVTTSSPATISAAFDGTIDYCGVSLAASPYDECYFPKTSAHQECTSKNHRLMLTRR